MSNEVKYGMIDWDDAPSSGGSKDFMNLTEGNNVVRIFTKPYQFWAAWVKDPSGANRKIRSAVKDCPLVKAGHKISPRWYVGVLDRKTGEPKILEIPSTVFKGIKDLKDEPDYGDPTQYDINIKRGPKSSSPAQLYNVLPKPRKSLTADEKALIAAFKERVDIAKFTTPPTPQEVAEKLGVALGEQAPQVAVGRQTVSAGSTAKPKITDEDFDFGDDDEL